MELEEIQIRVKKGGFQDHFLFSTRRFPAMISGVGTGKTYMMLLKIWMFCEDNPRTLALVVRKNYVDLRDSTINDFRKYFHKDLNGDKDYVFPNGSKIMFRHGEEFTVLKNLTLDIAGVEQAEEFQGEEQFEFLRDRMRGKACYLGKDADGKDIYRQQLCIIANANGRNWIWKKWINNPPSPEYDAVTATTYDNKENLPQSYIDDLKHRKTESPNHYRQYVMNSFEEIEADDLLFTYEALNKSVNLTYPERNNFIPKHVLAVDVARFGEDATVFTILEQKSPYEWEQILCESHRQKDLMWTVGRFVDLKREFHCDAGIVDDDGMGGGVSDRLKEMSLKVEMFRGGEKPKNEEFYFNRRAEEYFNLKEMIDKGYLKILNNPKLIDELMTIRFKYNSKGQRQIVSKDDMRKEGLKSPDMADSLMMAVSIAKKHIVKRTFTPESSKAY